MTAPATDEPGLQADSAQLDRAWVRIGAGTAVAAQAMVFSFSVNLSEIDGWAYIIVHGLLIVATLATLLFLGGELLRSAWDALRARRVSIDLLFLVTLLGAFIGSLVSTFTHAGSVYYEVVAILIVVHSVGKLLGARSRAAALRVVADLRKEFDRCEARSLDGTWSETATTNVRVGDEVRVHPGRVIPVDGEIVSGLGYVQEATLTGEWAPVSRRPGDRVLAGTQAVDADLIIRRTSAARRIDAVLNEVERARLAPSRLQEQADRLIAWFLPLVIGASAATFAAWWWLGPWQQALFNAMAVLLVACPCAMGLATPVAIWGGLAKLAQGGLTARSGDFIDVLARADTVFFDKTGTLSTDQMRVLAWRIAPAWETRAAWLKQAVVAVESGLDHPIARALATEEKTSEAARDVRVIAGRGVTGSVMSQHGVQHTVAVGRFEMGGALNSSRTSQRLVPTSDPANDPEQVGTSGPLVRLDDARTVFVFVDGELAATISLGETWRAGLDEALSELRALGLSVEILTGDASAPSELAGAPVRAGLLPEEKLAAVRARIAEGRTVVFVGDGVNDAGAMTAATGAVALRGGSDLARAAALAVFAGEDLRFLPWAVRLARQVRGSVRGNLLFAAIYNGIGMALAATGTLHPVAAVLLMVGSSFAVSVRALRSARVAALANKKATE